MRDGVRTISSIKPDHYQPGPNLRICLLGYRSEPYCGGQGVYIKYLSKALVNAGHSVDVISGEPYPHLDPRVRLIKMPGLNLFAAPNHITALRLRHLTSLTDTAEWAIMASGGFPEPYTFGRRVVSYLREHRDAYDLVHDNQSLSYGLLQLQQSGIPVVATIHHPITRDLKLALAATETGPRGWGMRLMIKRWHSFLAMQKKVARQLDHVITVSKLSRQDIAGDFGRPAEDIELIYNGIDIEEFRPLPEVPRKQLQLMTTSSADQPLKGLGVLLDAIHQLGEQFPTLELLVVGKLKEDGVTAKQLKRLKLSDRVRFVSGISTAEMVQHYAESTIAVSPSLYEGFGLPAGEAMACEVPLISSDGGALPEVVGDAGVIVPAGNAPALAMAISELLNNPQERTRLGQAGRRHIEKNFCWQLAAERLTEFYQQMIQPELNVADTEMVST